MELPNEKPGSHGKVVTLSGNPRCDGFNEHPEWGGPCPVDPATGMLKDYWVLSKEERSKGFVRPVRRSYIHVGIRPKYSLRDLTPEEHERYDKWNYVKYEEYPEGNATCGRFWTQKMLNSGCGTTTTMGLALSETYARDPEFYGSTFCCNCGTHFPVEEFKWEGTNEILGS
jgi:hypothetical protein